MSVFRKLLPSEAEKYRDHLLRLSPEDRHMRFAGTVSDARLNDHCAKFDWNSSYIIGYFVRGELVGGCEVSQAPNGKLKRGEAAFSVERKYQNQGIGTGLMRRALTIAQNRAFRIIDIICLLENRRMQALARRFNGKMEVEGGDVFFTIDLQAPSQVSLLLETIDDGEGMLTTLLDQLSYPGDRAHVPFHGWSA